ncbi:hypothetical protein [Segatella copri]|nr:hypothetical protein [Segatella copri]
MAKKNMDILLGNILGKAAIHPQDRFDKSPGKRLRVYTLHNSKKAVTAD